MQGEENMTDEQREEEIFRLAGWIVDVDPVTREAIDDGVLANTIKWAFGYYPLRHGRVTVSPTGRVGYVKNKSSSRNAKTLDLLDLA